MSNKVLFKKFVSPHLNEQWRLLLLHFKVWVPKQRRALAWECKCLKNFIFFLVFILDSAQVTSWVCATIPMAGTVTYDCIPEVAALSPCLHLDVLCPPTTFTQCQLSGCHSQCRSDFWVSISECQNIVISWWQVSWMRHGVLPCEVFVHFSCHHNHTIQWSQQS